MTRNKKGSERVLSQVIRGGLDPPRRPALGSMFVQCAVCAWASAEFSLLTKTANGNLEEDACVRCIADFVMFDPVVHSPVRTAAGNTNAETFPTRHTEAAAAVENFMVDDVKFESCLLKASEEVQMHEHAVVRAAFDWITSIQMKLSVNQIRTRLPEYGDRDQLYDSYEFFN